MNDMKNLPEFVLERETYSRTVQRCPAEGNGTSI